MSLVRASHEFSKEQSKLSLPVDLVGIQGLNLPVRLTSKIKVISQVSVFVSLEDKRARGIHMSRLYLHLHEYFEKNTLDLFKLKGILIKSIKSQKGLSQSGRLQVKSQWPVLQKSLKSSFSGWRDYPFYFELSYSKKKNKFQYVVGGEILYSSTCPCSAALSRKIIKKDFEKAFSGKSSLNKKEALKYLSDKEFLSATPHAQKSKLFFKLQLPEKTAKDFSLLKVIHDIEKSFGDTCANCCKTRG